MIPLSKQIALAEHLQYHLLISNPHMHKIFKHGDSFYHNYTFYTQANISKGYIYLFHKMSKYTFYKY